MTEQIDYRQFSRAHRRILFDEWRSLVAAGYITEQGLLAVRSRLLHGAEFERGSERGLLLAEVNEAYAAMHGIDPADVPTDPELTVTVPDDASELEPPP